MAAKKKKKAQASNLVVGSKVKEAIKASGYRCSGDLVDALNEHVQSILEGAVERCDSNNRGTVRPHDL